MMEREDSVVAIVPMKALANSKNHLSRRLSSDQRADLVIAMLRRVLSAIRGTSISMFWVVGGDQRVRNTARNFGGLWLEELGRGLNDTLGKAFDRAFERDSSALYVAGDLPFLRSGDLHSLLRSSRRHQNICLAPARRDGGTNAILVPRGIHFRTQLGPHSFTRLLDQADVLEVPVAICYSAGLGFDLDITEDLETYEQMEPGFLERLGLDGIAAGKLQRQ